MNDKRHKICFISKSIHYVLFGEKDEIIGGAEIQQQILASMLVEKGWNTNIITESVNNNTTKKTKNGINVFFSLKYKYGNKFLNKFLFLPLSLWRALKDVDAEVYYQRNPDFLSGIITLFCMINRKKFFLAGANDWNFDKGSEKNLNNIFDKFSARLAIKYATKIILQNKNQKKLLSQNYGRAGQIFHNIFPEQNSGKKDDFVLWVARMVPYKRPDLYMELAKMLPEIQFVMVGGKGDSEVERNLLKSVSQIDNISYLGHQEFEKVEKLFDKAFLFVNTSIPGCEGFPNTFLQAWSRGIPVVSFFDLDNLIKDKNLGCKVESLSEMAFTLKRLIFEDNFYKLKSKDILSFFRENFAAEKQIANFIQILIN